MNIVWKDFVSFMQNLKNLSVSKSLDFSEKSFCVSTGCSHESWVCYPEDIKNPEDVESVIKFFSEENISFMWPVYSEGEEILRDCGLIYAGDLTAMSLELSSQRKISYEEKNIDYKIWAKTAWQGFDGEIDDMQKNYFALVKSFMQNKNFSLHLKEHENKPVGTFLLNHEQDITGVYYFATIPEERRKGIARSMMSEICEISDGKTIVLQATPSGVPFYKSFGFEELFKIKIYSTESDIF